jgi:flagellar hook-associated protein 3 FlgL
MVMRVATFPLSEQMIASALRTQSMMASQQLQESSGEVSPNYGGLGQSSQQVISLQISVTRAQSYIDAATSAGNKTQAMYSAVTTVSNLLNSFRSTLTAADSASTDATATQQTAQQLLQEMGSLLNTQYAGSYLFGGGQTTNPPVDVSSASYPAMTSPSSASTSYYKGDDETMSVRVSDSETVSYGVTADNPAFEQALRALNLVANNSPLSSDTLNEAMSLTTSAIDATANVQAGLGISSSAIQSASASQSDYQNFAKTLGDNLTNVDVAAVTAQISTYTAQLEAAYSAISKIQSLNLTSYLR